MSLYFCNLLDISLLFELFVDITIGFFVKYVYKDIDVMTPGLNLVLGDPYEVVVERTIPNV